MCFQQQFHAFFWCSRALTGHARPHTCLTRRKLQLSTNFGENWRHFQVYNTYNTTESLPRSGRPYAISDRTRRQVLREVKENLWEPYPSIARRLNNVIEHQVRDIAEAAGYHRRIARRKQFIFNNTIENASDGPIATQIPTEPRLFGQTRPVWKPESGPVIAMLLDASGRNTCPKT